jgi:hypothetical protein
MSFEQPQIMSREVLRQRLWRVAAETPSGAEFLNNSAARLTIRMRDIAHYIGMDAQQLRRFSRGEMMISAEKQRRLSWMFHLIDRGLLVKELRDGKGVLVGRNPDQVLKVKTPVPPKPTNQACIVLTPQGPRIRSYEGSKSSQPTFRFRR